jgi:hypothetical protein
MSQGVMLARWKNNASLAMMRVTNILLLNNLDPLGLALLAGILVAVLIFILATF